MARITACGIAPESQKMKAARPEDELEVELADGSLHTYPKRERVLRRRAGADEVTGSETRIGCYARSKPFAFANTSIS